MKNKILHLLLFCVVGVQAQTLSYTQALERAQSVSVEKADKELAVAQLKLKIQKAKQIPLIYGEANLQRNLVIPVTPVPSIAFDPSAQPGEITPLKFATNWSARAGVNGSWDLFNPVAIANRADAKNQVNLAEIEREIAQQEIHKQITTTYAQAVLAQQQLYVANELVKVYKKVSDIVNTRFNAGRASAYDKNNADKKLGELNYLVLEAESVLTNQFLNLADYVDVAGIDSLSTSFDLLVEQTTNANFNAEEKRILAKQEFNAKQKRLSQLQSLPKVTLNAYYGSNYYDNSLQPFTSSNWFGNSYVNLNVRIPLTEIYENSLKSKQVLLENEVLQTNLKEINQQDSKKQTQKLNTILALINKVEMQKKALRLSQENYNIVALRVEEGRSLLTELATEFDVYLQDHKNVWQSQYDLILKIVE